MRSVSGAWDPDVIDQAIPKLESSPGYAAPAGSSGFGVPDEPPVPLGPVDRQTWDGERFATKEGGELDRSRTLFWIACGLARGIADSNLQEAARVTVITEALANRDQVLGYKKYAGRSDCSAQYQTAARKALREVAAQATIKFSRNGAKENAQTDHEAPPETSSSPAKGTPTHDELRDRWIRAAGVDNPYAHGLGEWRRYDAGVWPAVAETSVKAGICEVVEAAKPEGVKPTASIISSVTEMARIKVFIRDEQWDADPDILICKNGALRISTCELVDHRPGHYATSMVPYDYDPAAVPIMWRSFLKRTVPAAADFLQEFAGYALTIDTAHEIAVWLHGPRGSGKSTFIAGLQAMLGHRAGVLGLADLERSRFTLANLVGKTLMVAREQPTSYLASTDVLDTIISGEPLQVEQKYRDPYTVTPRAKVCWAMNELPRVANANAGIFRRVKVVSFPELPADQRDPEVKRQIETEGAGILNWALVGLRRLKERGYFEIPESIREATTEFENSNDVTAAFLEAECVREQRSRLSGQKLYNAYKIWCEENGHRPLSSTRIPQEWRRLDIERKRISGVSYYEGVRLKMPSEKRDDF